MHVSTNHSLIIRNTSFKKTIAIYVYARLQSSLKATFVTMFDQVFNLTKCFLSNHVPISEKRQTSAYLN
jgi:hypothetical protein